MNFNTSTPLTWGSIKSSSTTSGGFADSCRIAVLPSPATETSNASD
jgi:hypothetical protein